MARLGRRATALRAIIVAAAACAAGGACSRSGLEVFGASGADTPGSGGNVDGAAPATTPFVDARAPTMDADGNIDAMRPPVPTTTSTGPPTMPPPTATTPNPPSPPGCVPSEEKCNGIDDDCNGQVDDGIAPIPCPGGGERYCVAGRMSACPTRCETCIPGSERVCFLSYCTYWARQVCAADGRSFGLCQEHHVPPECDAVASKYKLSPQIEQCCIDNNYCCRDEFDLDHDGDTAEMLGKCDEVSCG